MRSLLLIIFFIIDTSSFSQSKTWILKSGAGFPTLLHLEADYQYNANFSTGINIGSDFRKNDLTSLTMRSISINQFFHIGISKKFKEATTGFIKFYFNYLYENNESYLWESYFFGTSVGRRVNFSNHLGFAFDVGVIAPLKKIQLDVEEISPSSGSYQYIDDNDHEDLRNYNGFLPSINLHFFYKFPVKN